MRSPSHSRSLATLLALFAVLSSPACSEGSATGPQDEIRASQASATALDRGAAQYIDSATCAECHPLEAQGWTGSHHDLAMQPADAASVLGDFDDATFTHAGVTTTFFRRG